MEYKMATRMTSFAAISNILPFAMDKKMEQNQNDNASNVAMSNTFRCHINNYHCFKVQNGVRDDCQLIVSDLVDFYNYIREQKWNFPHKPGCKLYYVYYALFKLIPSMQRSHLT